MLRNLQCLNLILNLGEKTHPITHDQEVFFSMLTLKYLILVTQQHIQKHDISDTTTQKNSAVNVYNNNK